MPGPASKTMRGWLALGTLPAIIAMKSSHLAPQQQFRALLALAPILVLALLVGCGGGGGGSNGSGSTSVTNGSSSGNNGSTSGNQGPTATTKAHANDILVAYGQALVSNSFAGYGPKTLSGGTAKLDPILNLWFTIRFGPSIMQEFFYGDEARTIPAGGMVYNIVDVAMTMNGDITVTQGPYAGLTGTYFESNNNPGFNGSIQYTMPGVGQTVDQYAGTQNTDGTFNSTATVGIALNDDYTSSLHMVNSADGTIAMTGNDANKLKSKFQFEADFSGTGQITGSDPGLPATVTTDATGAGTIRFADNSTETIIGWQLAG